MVTLVAAVAVFAITQQVDIPTTITVQSTNSSISVYTDPTLTTEVTSIDLTATTDGFGTTSSIDDVEVSINNDSNTVVQLSVEDDAPSIVTVMSPDRPIIGPGEVVTTTLSFNQVGSPLDTSMVVSIVANSSVDATTSLSATVNAVGGTVEVDVLASLPAGFTGATIDAVYDSSVVSLTGYTSPFELDSQSGDSVSVADLTNIYGPTTQNVQLMTLIFTGVSVGSTDLTLSSVAFDDENGNSYTVEPVTVGVDVQ